VQDQSEFIFFYKDDVIENKKRISLSFKDAKVDKVLDKAFLGTNLTYKIIGQQIVVRTVRGQSLLDLRENFDLGPPQITVAGTIRDISGQPLPGVNVLVEGTTQGTQSDFDGHYSIRAAENATLVFSYLGMLTQKIVTDARTTINVTLREDVASLDEVVVVGYGTQTKESVTGSVGTVKSTQLEQVPVSTFEQSLRGSIAGLQATAVDGAPGGNTQVRIRGIGSITASSEPLYVIDGTPIQNGSIGTIDNDGTSTNVMATINPNDIASISVLKDAASTAIYGSRGANGVILITTKSGSSGKPRIVLKTLTGFNSQAYKKILRPLNAAQYTE